MRNITNNHTSTLGVAGHSIAPGKTIGVTDDEVRVALNSNAVKIWIRMNLIEIEGIDAGEIDQPLTPVNNGGVSFPSLPGAAAARQALEDRAEELGVKGQLSKMKDETLTSKIAEAEAAGNS